MTTRAATITSKTPSPNKTEKLPGSMVIIRHSAMPAQTTDVPTVQTRKQIQKRRLPSCFFLSLPVGFQPSGRPRIVSQ